MLTSVIDYKEDKDVTAIYVPNFFIQKQIDGKTGERNHNENKGITGGYSGTDGFRKVWSQFSI